MCMRSAFIPLEIFHIHVANIAISIPTTTNQKAVARMDKVERASLAYLQTLYNTGELPFKDGEMLEAEHQVNSKKTGTRRYKILIQEIPIGSEDIDNKLK